MAKENQPLLSKDDEEKGAFHPTGVAFRYCLLFVISLICFGSYFTYDEIQPAQYRNAFDGYITDDNFGILYSVYSIPNTVLVFFGGILGDKIGLRLAGMIFVTLCVFGSVVVAIASSLIGSNSHGITPHQAFLLTIIGRVIFGCGAESLNVIQNSMITRWFSGGRELAFAMGLVLSMSRLGDLFALSGTVYVYDLFNHNYNYVLWLGAILCGVSLLCVIIYSIIDKATEKHFPNRTINPEENALNFRSVLNFDLRFWLIAVICMSYYGGIFPFIAICSDFLVREYGLGTIDAENNTHPDTLNSILSGIITLSSLCLSPFLGKFLDIVARRPYFVMFGSMAVIPAHLWLALHIRFPVIPFVIMGLSFSLVPSALWPSIPLVVKGSEVATAFGVMAAIQNSGLAIINFVSGKLAHSYGYGVTMYFFVLMDCIGLIFAILLVVVDLSRGGLLINPKKNEAAKEDVAPVASSGEAQAGTINY